MTSRLVEAVATVLPSAEAARRLGDTTESVDRRWALARDSVLNGLAVAV
ncbi:hypothetical protein ACIRRA_10965 [Nocardia sp. NPDC101769]